MYNFSHRFFSFSRMSAIAGNTFTGLTRLKIFYVLLLFALLLIGSSVFMAQMTFQQEFQVLKDIALGAMSIFTSLLAVIATARLLPQDIAALKLWIDAGAPPWQKAQPVSSYIDEPAIEQTILQRHFLCLIHNWLTLFDRDLKMTVLFQLALGSFPPFFPIITNHIGDQHFLNLIDRGFATKAVQDELDQFQMIGGGHLAQPFQIGRFTRQDVFFGNRFKGFRGKSEIHRMTGFVWKVDSESCKNRIHSLNASKTPAPVHAKPTGG